MKDNRGLGTIAFALSGSPSTKRARLDIGASPARSWPASKDLFVVAGWLLFVECESTFIPDDLLPLTLGTLMGKMAVYFEYGTAGRPMAPDPSFERLGTAKLALSFDSRRPVPSVIGWPRHYDLHPQLHPGALISMMVCDSVEALSETLEEAAKREAFCAMTFGLEKWARQGIPTKGRIPDTWDFLDIPNHARQGERIVKGGWLTRQTWPLQPFTGYGGRQSRNIMSSDL